MNGETYIPPATADKLATEFPTGTRHKAALDIATPLIGNGMPESAVLATLRAKFPPDVTDKELSDIVTWVKRRAPAPSVNGRPRFETPRPSTVVLPKSPVEHSDWWCSGARMTPEAMQATSPTTIPLDASEYAPMAFASLYRSEDNVNVVCKFVADGEKARPLGGGKILPRDKWIERFQKDGVPSSEAGGWIRLNPCSAKGSGSDGSVTDADIVAWRYVLVESDVLPLELQLALLRRFRLPIAAVIVSGASSAHGWVRVNAVDEAQFRDRVAKLFALLKPFGFDQANRNPSRLGRLPGAIRKIGALGNGEQKVVWLDPNVGDLNDECLARFDESLVFPFVDDKPLLPIAREAINRYEWMKANSGKLGVTTGIPKLDEVSGGFKPGNTIVVAGKSGGGKTTLAIHFAVHALESGVGVALFSLEMDKEDIFDLMVARKARVERNKFNHGKFDQKDLEKIAVYLPKISRLPLYIEDSALITVEQMRLRVLQLKADNRIGLVIVDYIQFVNPGITKEPREQQIAGISHGLRALAREVKLPTIVLSQLNDEGLLRESRVIGHNADIVFEVGIDPNNKDKFIVRTVKGRRIPKLNYELDFIAEFVELTGRSKADELYAEANDNSRKPYPDAP